MGLRLRVPCWATAGGAVTLNGRPLESFASPSSYLVLNRNWRDGDVVEMTLPIRLHVCPMPDDASLQALMYGHLVLAGRLGREGLTPEILRAEPTKVREIPRYRSNPVPAPEFEVKSADPESWIRPVASRTLEFESFGQARNVTLVPLYKILDERYAVYWRVKQARS